MHPRFTIGDRVALIDRDAEFGRLWPGSVTAVVQDGGGASYSYRVKLDAGLTWAAIEDNLIPIPPDEDDPAYFGEDDPAAGELTWLEALAARRENG